MQRKTRRNIDKFARIQQSSSRIRYMLKPILNKAEIYAKAYKEAKND